MRAAYEIHQTRRRKINRVTISSSVGRIKRKPEVRNHKVRKIASFKLRREKRKMSTEEATRFALVCFFFFRGVTARFLSAAARTDKIF